MLSDPQKITIGESAIDFSRRLTGSDLGQFVSPNDDGKLEVRTVPTVTRTKHTVRLVSDKTFNDGNGLPAKASSTISLEINRPKEGFTHEDLQALVGSLTSWLGTGASAPLLRVLRGEN